MATALLWVAFMWFMWGRIGRRRRRRHFVHAFHGPRAFHPAHRYAQAARAVPPPQPETEFDRLKRDYVEDRITVEEYERRLDELLRR